MTPLATPAPRPSATPAPPRNAPAQDRSRRRLARVLDAAERVLAEEGTESFTTRRIADVARLPIGAVYRFFPDKQAIAEALAVRYWSDFADVVTRVAEDDRARALGDPTGAVLDALAAAFRANRGFLELWYSELRSQRVRDATRPAREAISGSIQEILERRWPAAPAAERERVATMVVLAGDGLLREAFRTDRGGQRGILEESKLMLEAYIEARLG